MNTIKSDRRIVFSQSYCNRRIAQIALYSDHACEISYTDGTGKLLRIPCDPVYLSQYGLPISEDGELLFISSWEDGLTALRTEDGTVVWHHPGGKMTRVFVFLQFVVAVRNGKAIMKFDLATGQVLEEIKSTTIERAFYLRDDYLLVDTVKGRLSVLAVRPLCVVKRYQKQAVNPNGCLSLVIRNAFLRDNTLWIAGFEECPNKNICDEKQYPFERLLDPAFDDV